MQKARLSSVRLLHRDLEGPRGHAQCRARTRTHIRGRTDTRAHALPPHLWSHTANTRAHTRHPHVQTHTHAHVHARCTRDTGSRYVLTCVRTPPAQQACPSPPCPLSAAAPAGTQQGPSGPQHKWADGTVSPSPPLRLQDHHRAEVHAGREGRDEPLWTPVCSWDPRGLTSSGPTQKAFGGCPRSVLGAGLAALSASPSCVGGFSVPPSLARGPGCFPLSLTSGTGLSRSLASHIPRSGGLSSVRHGLCPATPLLPQVMGLGLSSVFALCLGHTSSFCTSVVFASASIGLQTFNHRYVPGTPHQSCPRLTTGTWQHPRPPASGCVGEDTWLRLTRERTTGPRFSAYHTCADPGYWEKLDLQMGRGWGGAPSGPFPLVQLPPEVLSRPSI